MDKLSNSYWLMKRVLLLIVSVLYIGSVAAQNSTGKFNGLWNGVIEAGGQEIKMEFEILEQDGVPVGKMNAQGVKGIPATVKTDGAAIEIEIKQIGMKYLGFLLGNNISGTFSQNGFNTAMVLYPGKLEVRRPQTPKAPFPYRTEEVTFENKAEGAVLSGTLTYPAEYEKMKHSNVPVVVMVTGSGLQNRDEEIFDHKPFAVIADYLARNGIASLRYDDRGAGKSAGDIASATSENFAADAKAGVKFVRDLKKFGKVGILGHSEGGTIAVMLAGERVPDFIVSMAGVATQGLDCLVWQNVELLAQKGVPQQMSEDYGKALRELYLQKTAQGEKVEQPEQFVEEICRKAGVSLHQSLKTNLVAVAATQSKWLDFFVMYNPAEAVGKIKCPVMALNGSLDMQVPAAENLGTLEKLLPQNGKHFFKGYPDKNHLFQSCTKATSLQYGEIEETIAPEVLEDIVKWVKGL